jgi:transposase
MTKPTRYLDKHQVMKLYMEKRNIRKYGCISEIAKELKANKSTIAKIIHRYKKSPVNKKRGRKSKLLDQEQDGIKKFLIACVEKAVPITQNRVCKAVNRITSGRVSITNPNQWRFVRRFMHKNGFSYRRLRKLHAKSYAKEDTIKQINEYFKNLQAFKRDNSTRKKVIFVFDETPLYEDQVLSHSWCLKGMENRAIKGEAERDTLVGTIRVCGEEVSLMPAFFIRHSNSYRSVGGMNQSVMIDFLDWISTQANGPKKEDDNLLLCDNLSSHKTKSVKLKAEELNMRLMFLPSRMAIYLSPLDNFVFGAFQSKWRSWNMNNHILEKNEKWNICSRIWNSLSSVALESVRRCKIIGEPPEKISSNQDLINLFHKKQKNEKETSTKKTDFNTNHQTINTSYNKSSIEIITINEDETLTEKIPWNQFKSYLQQEGGITDTQLKLLACKVGLSISRVFVIVDASEAYDILQCIVSDLHASHFVAYVIFSDNHFTALAAIREDPIKVLFFDSLFDYSARVYRQIQQWDSNLVTVYNLSKRVQNDSFSCGFYAVWFLQKINEMIQQHTSVNEIIMIMQSEIEKVDANSIEHLFKVLHNSFDFRRFKDQPTMSSVETTSSKPSTQFCINDIMNVNVSNPSTSSSHSTEVESECNQVFNNETFVVWPDNFFKSYQPSLIDDVVDDLIEEEELQVLRLQNQLQKSKRVSKKESTCSKSKKSKKSITSTSTPPSKSKEESTKSTTLSSTSTPLQSMKEPAMSTPPLQSMKEPTKSTPPLQSMKEPTMSTQSSKPKKIKWVNYSVSSLKKK